MPANLQEELGKLPKRVAAYVEEKALLCQPARVHVCDGSQEERNRLTQELYQAGVLEKLHGYENCWAARTDPRDVARVESKTVISTPKQITTIPKPKDGVKGLLGNWMSPSELDQELSKRYPGCMKGRTMYVIPFSMGPVGSKLAKIGVELTDSAFVVVNMYIMTRVGKPVLDLLHKDDSQFVRALHSVGAPEPHVAQVKGWPCNPEQTIISHIPERNEICSFGSGYGGNSLLGKKCFALRIASAMGHREGWFAEHMLIVGVQAPNGRKHYLTGAFPSACGKTNLAMLESALPGYRITCVGDDIAWMRFGTDGRLYAMNPENGFFGVAPGTSLKTNPNAMAGLQRNCIFTNVATTKSGKYFWEGLEHDADFSKEELTDWKGQPWTLGCGRVSAHPNSRFTAPASQCPIIDPDWESQQGVPIDGIIFGGRRPEGVPLVYESFDWDHGVFVGASMRSESTAAAEHTGKTIMHDPFAMRPFFGYNFADYLAHWLSFGKKSGLKLPKVFHVNWFRKDTSGNFMWPGYGDNIRVLDWIVRRIEGSVPAERHPFGLVPKANDFNVSGMNPTPDLTRLFAFDKAFWKQEVLSLRKYFEEQIGEQMPEQIMQILGQIETGCS